MECRIKSIAVRNLRSLENVTFDLTEGSAGVPRALALVYGENGSGKTNLLDAVTFLKMTSDTCLLAEAAGLDWHGPDTFTGGASLDGEGSRIHEYRVPWDVSEASGWNITSLADRFRTCCSETGPEVELRFIIDGRDGSYTISLGEDGRVEAESLHYLISRRSGDIFTIKRTEGGNECEFSTALFSGAAQKRRYMSMIQSAWGEHSFISLVKADAVLNGRPEGMGTGLFEFIGFLDSVVVSTSESRMAVSDGLDPVLRHMEKGRIPSSLLPRLSECSICLDYLMDSLFSDVRGVYYRKTEADGMVDYELWIKRKCWGREVEVPASSESEGIRRIIAMFPALYMCTVGRVVLIDDLDANIHVCMVPELLAGEMRGCRGQLIAATHCTALLDGVDAHDCYVIQVDIDARRRVVSFPKVERTMENHNNRLRYESGTFEGVPVTGYVEMGVFAQIAAEDKGEDATRRNPSKR